MQIRKAKEVDISEIVSLTQMAWEGATVAQLLEKKYGIVEGKKWYEYKGKEIENFCKNNLDKVLVAEENSKVVGYATYYLDKDRKIGTVGNNAVHPDFRGRGIGSALHKEVLEELKKADMEIALVSTLEIDKPAQHVYEKHNFKEFAHTIHYSQKLK